MLDRRQPTAKHRLFPSFREFLKRSGDNANFALPRSSSTIKDDLEGAVQTRLQEFKSAVVRSLSQIHVVPANQGYHISWGSISSSLLFAHLSDGGFQLRVGLEELIRAHTSFNSVVLKGECAAAYETTEKMGYVMMNNANTTETVADEVTADQRASGRI